MSNNKLIVCLDAHTKITYGKTLEMKNHMKESSSCLCLTLISTVYVSFSSIENIV